MASKTKTTKQKKTREEELAQDQRNFQLRFRAEMIADAMFLANKAANRLRQALRYYPDLSLNPDFDESRDVANALKFLEMAQEEIAEGGYDIEYNQRQQLREEYAKQQNGPVV